MNINQINRKSVNWNVTNLINQMNKGNALFDIEVQRALVWNIRQKSLLIHSIIMDYPIPPLFCISKNKKYEFIDGKQRATTIYEFVNGKFALRDFPLVETEDEGSLDFNNKKFDELPQEVQDTIRGYNLSISTCDEQPQSVIEELFFRLNNGTSLRSADKNFAKSKFKTEIYDLSQHALFKKALNESSLTKMVQRTVVIQSLIMLKDNDNPSFDSRYTSNFLANTDITSDDVALLKAIFDNILEVVFNIEHSREQKYEKDSGNSRKTKRIIKHILAKGNIPILVPFFNKYGAEKEVEGFLQEFFGGDKKSTNNDSYNIAAGSGAGHAGNIAIRKAVLEEKYLEYKENVSVDE